MQVQTPTAVATLRHNAPMPATILASVATTAPASTATALTRVAKWQPFDPETASVLFVSIRPIFESGYEQLDVSREVIYHKIVAS